MNYISSELITNQKIKIANHLNDIGIDTIRKEIIRGLTSPQKKISSKFFYDKKGSSLFEAITQLPEYYPTRTEKSILTKLAPQLMSNLKHTDIIELGSGDCSKIKILLNSVPETNLKGIRYIPVDVSQSAIQRSTQELIELFPNLTVNAFVADFINQLELIPNNNKRMFCFLGSTLGNFTKDISAVFLKNLSNTMNPGDTFLLGLDLVKPVKILYDAYNDNQGITAAFNKNILNVVNELIESDFDPNHFEHQAFFNDDKSRIEMHLIANTDMQIHSPYSNAAITIEKGENIHTENSHKYSLEHIHAFEKMSGLKKLNTFTDSNNWFAIVLFEK